MTLTDPIGDMLTRVRNANSVGKETVSMPSSKKLVEIARVMAEEGYITVLQHRDNLISIYANNQRLLRSTGEPVKAGIARKVRRADVETVYIPDGDRATLCVSSQVGCKMGCLFCQTGRQGFEGNLTAGDILNQIYALPERDTLTNVVFMGQGEPMDNLDNVLRATEILTASYGMAWSPKRITVSSVGVKSKLRRFLDESDCHVAISLHSPIPEQRAMLMPAERAMPITDVVALLRTYDFSHQRRLSFEYIVFGGLNDTIAHAKEILRLLRGLECRVNLIRFHQIPDSDLREASEERMEQLRDYLTQHGIFTTIRASRGQDIYAACGLLSTAKRIAAERGQSL